MSARDFPMPRHPRPNDGPWCRWCGDPITTASRGRINRSWHDGRADEPHCLYDYYLHTRRREQRAFLVERDGEHCWDCGAEPMRWLNQGEVTVIIEWNRLPEIGGNYTRVELVSALEVEHSTPLWAVAHLPDDERRPYFGPMNLRLRCPSCHAVKSAKEARDRAHVKRLERPKKPKGRWGSRPLQSPGFDKTRTRGMDGRVRPR